MGGVHLGAHIRDICDPIFETANPPLESFELLMPYQAWYKLAGIRVGVLIDVRTGLVFKLSAYEGYAGKLFDRIEVGMLARDALNADSRLYYDHGNNLILCDGVAGVELEVPDDDPDPDQVPAMRIVGISIWRADLLKAATRRAVALL